MIFPYYRFCLAAERLAVQRTNKFLRREKNKRGPFTKEEESAILNRAIFPCVCVQLLRRLAVRGHEIDWIRIP